MALQLQYTDPQTQVSSNYWDTVSLSQDPINNITYFNLGFYASTTAKQNGASPITSVNFTIPGILSEAQCFAYLIANYSTFTNAVII